MAESRAEQIEVKVLELLSGISVANGFNYDYKAVSRKLKQPEEVSQHPVIFCPPSTETGEQLVEGSDRVKVVPIWGYHDTEASGTQLNKIRQDVERALFAGGDVRMGLDFVIGMNPGTIRAWQVQGQGRQEVIRIEMHVKYRYDRGDP